MATRRELQQLACLRLDEAEALFAASCYDGCAYLCGYVVELALKAAICSTLRVAEYPEKGSRLKESFKTHDFDDLKLLAGMEEAFTANSTLLANWSVASRWKPERRYWRFQAGDALQFCARCSLKLESHRIFRLDRSDGDTGSDKDHRSGVAPKPWP